LWLKPDFGVTLRRVGVGVLAERLRPGAFVWRACFGLFWPLFVRFVRFGRFVRGLHDFNKEMKRAHALRDH